MPLYKVKGKSKDGLQKYNVRVNYTCKTTGKGKQLTRTAYGLENAKGLEMTLQKQMKDGEQTSNKTTISQLYQDFSATRQLSIRHTTRRKDDSNFRAHIEPILGHVRVDRLSIKMLQDWKQQIESKGLSPKTRQGVYGTLRVLLNWAVKNDCIAKNPLLIVGNFQKPKVDFYTAEEFKKFIAVAKNHAEEHEINHNSIAEWEFYVFFSIAFWTGLRKGEIHALRWNDVAGKTLSVSKSVQQISATNEILSPPKSKSSIRTLELPNHLLDILHQHKERKRHLQGDNGRICGIGLPLVDTAISRKRAMFAELAGVKKIRTHDFRHSHASVLTNAGINIQEIARRLGHAKVEMTWNTYSHLYPREEEKAVGVLDSIA